MIFQFLLSRARKKSQSQEMPDFDFLIIESDYEMCSFGQLRKRG
ncbi:hypothetical protein SC09_Contig24orf00815 [Bacillus subtilis]|uniref:Uncharacterized protein n=1 Tax=Bacillus subtilis TaxID=1423 RepID=A0A0D1KZY8_BACIU|nr:hypothetical protein SC09_Contig24orf00815 [Bacillus subtilis]